SLIAVCSTIAKSALLVALKQDLCQLKWNHFEKRRNTLDQFQYFEDASRGPWGSTMLLVRMWKKRISPIVVVGAVLNILALALEPLTQQII
ncbi:hypothetical protein K458DRAFT_284643, partial [Lentithecium fluviatile CBS 122367]